MQISEYLEQDGTGLARLVRDGEVTPEELVNCAASQAATWNPRINAVLELFSERDPTPEAGAGAARFGGCLLYTSDAADDASSV